MQPIVELRNAYGAVYFRMGYEPERRYLYCDWIGFLLLQEMMEAGHAAVAWAQAQARREHCVAVVNDNGRMRGSWDIALEWIQEVWAPAMQQAGIVANAIIRSPDESTQLSAEAMAAPSAGGLLETRVFDDLPTAQAWLDQVRRPVPDGTRGSSGDGASAA